MSYAHCALRAHECPGLLTGNACIGWNSTANVRSLFRYPFNPHNPCITLVCIMTDAGYILFGLDSRCGP